MATNLCVLLTQKFFSMKTSKKFNAVRESRKWKQEAARKLEGMSHAEEIAFFRKLREEYAASQAARRELVLTH